MATTRVIEIIRRVETLLQDTNVRWPRLELQDWLNEAYLNVLLARPDANALTGVFACAAGSRQSLTTAFPSALRLLDVPRNLAATSTKRAVRQISRHVLDDQRPAWHNEAQADSIQHWMFDPRQPKEFFVYPPASANAELEVVYTAPVGAHNLTENQLDPESGTTDVILLDDLYAGPLVDWVCYRALSKDAEYAANAQRAAAHLATFTSTIGAKNQSDTAVTPTVPSSVT